MKKNLFLLLSLLLSSCQLNDDFIEKRIVLDKVPEIQDKVKQETTALCSSFPLSDENSLYSPIGSMQINQYRNNQDDFLSLYNQMIIKNSSLELRENFACAATDGLQDNGKFKDYIKTFTGSKEQLNKNISKYFNIDYQGIDYPGIYYFSYLSLSDSFPEKLPIKTDLPFNSDGKHTYCEYQNYGYYYEDEQINITKINIGSTNLILMMEKNSVTANPSLLFSTKLNYGLLNIKIPEFSLEYTYNNYEESTRVESQKNQFSFDRNGVKGTSLTINGPTSTKPQAPDYTVSFDHSFTFLSLLDDTPLFIGRITRI